MSLNTAISKLDSEQIEFLLNNSIRKSSLLGYEFESLCFGSWKFLKETAPSLIKLGNFEKLIVEVFKDRKINIFVSDINNSNYNECLYFIFWIIDDLKHWTKTENEYLSAEPDPKLLVAGINDLNQFGELNTVDSLANGDVTKYEEIKQLPYHVIFDKQFKSKIEGNINRKLAKQK